MTIVVKFAQSAVVLVFVYAFLLPRTFPVALVAFSELTFSFTRITFLIMFVVSFAFAFAFARAFAFEAFSFRVLIHFETMMAQIKRNKQVLFTRRYLPKTPRFGIFL